jgi:hypothetical protein
LSRPLMILLKDDITLAAWIMDGRCPYIVAVSCKIAEDWDIYPFVVALMAPRHILRKAFMDLGPLRRHCLSASSPTLSSTVFDVQVLLLIFFPFPIFGCDFVYPPDHLILD